MPRCFDTLTICAAKIPRCIPIATSLRPCDLTKPNPLGFICGGRCGIKRRFWFFWVPCGEPLTVRVCVDDENPYVARRESAALAG